jgi:hypothetical protein
MAATAAASAGLAQGRSGAAATHPPQAQAWYHDATAALEARSDAASLATAALLIHGTEPHSADAAMHALRLVERAVQADPTNHALGWLRLRLCEKAPGCDAGEAAASMRWLDPDNAAAWLTALQRAAAEQDETAIEHALAGMSQASRLRYYWNPTLVMALDALHAQLARDRHAPAAHAQLARVAALAPAALVPSSQPLFDACQATAPAPRRDTCQHIATLLQSADTIAAQLAGYSLQRRLAPPESAQARIAQERHRALETRVAREARFETAFLPWFRNRVAVHRIELMRQHEREEDCINAVLQEHHVEI